MNQAILGSMACILLLGGCAYQKNVQLLRGGELSVPEAQTIPFDYRKDLIIVTVRVNGQTGEFLLDTGAFDSKI